MRAALSTVALLALFLPGGQTAHAQNVAPPAAEAPLPPKRAAPAPPTGPPPAAAQPAPSATGQPETSAAGPIATLQQQLQRQGYSPGPVNGVMTEKTRQALAAYERRTGRPPQTQTAASANAAADPVKQAQLGLQRLGLFSGQADGVVGPRTRDAIIRFQAARHLTIDPRVSDRLLAEIARAGAFAGSAAVAGATAAPQPAPASQPPAPEATGRQPLPPGVQPPPIR